MATSWFSTSTDADAATATRRGLIMLVGNDLSARHMLCGALEVGGYDVLEASDPESVLKFLPAQPLLIIADLDKPAINCDDLLVELRDRNGFVPIVALSVRSDENSIVRAFDFGADAYLTKPFGMKELLARMRSMLRRSFKTVHEEVPLLRSGSLSVDLTRRLVKVDDRQVKLTRAEYGLLCILLQNSGKVLTHRFLQGELCYHPNIANLRCYIRQLRNKIEADPHNPRLMLTQPGIGYWMLAPSSVGMTKSELRLQPSVGLKTEHLFRSRQQRATRPAMLAAE